jgi:hypothetical protein
MVMTHHLQPLIKKTHVLEYETILTNQFGANDLNELENFTGLQSPFASSQDVKNYWDPILSNVAVVPSSYTGSWMNILRPNQDQGVHIHTDLGYDYKEETNVYTAILYLKFNPEVHKSTYFCDNANRAYEYKPSDITEGDCLVFPANLYHRAPLNTSDENRIVLVCVFQVN